MKKATYNPLKQPIVNVEQQRYLAWLIILAPLLNFLSGISVDLYAPSLPALANYYSVPISSAKNTISATMIGFAIGCCLFGVLIDSWGRRSMVLLGLFLFVVTSVLTLFAKSIELFTFARFIQGLTISTAVIGSRALVIDNFSGKALAIALLYTSVAYACGPIIAPFIGGLLQYYFGWQANFIAYAGFGLLLFSLLLIFVKESLTKSQPISLRNSLQQYYKIICDKPFMMGIVILGGVLTESMVYPAVGPFIIESVLQKSAVYYGTTALIIGLNYLVGTLVNRVLMNYFSQQQLLSVGFISLIGAMLIQWVFAFSTDLNSITLVLPIALFGFSAGFIFPNILHLCLKRFPKNAGVASAVQACTVMLVGAIGVWIISYFDIINLLGLATTYTIIISIQTVIFLRFHRAIHQETIKHQSDKNSITAIKNLSGDSK